MGAREWDSEQQVSWRAQEGAGAGAAGRRGKIGRGPRPVGKRPQVSAEKGASPRQLGLPCWGAGTGSAGAGSGSVEADGGGRPRQGRLPGLGPDSPKRVRVQLLVSSAPVYPEHLLCWGGGGTGQVGGLDQGLCLPRRLRPAPGEDKCTELSALQG